MLTSSGLHRSVLIAGGSLSLAAGVAQAQQSRAVSRPSTQPAPATEVLQIPAAPPARDEVVLTSRYDRFRDTSATIVEAHLGMGERKRGGFAGLLDRVTQADAGTIIVRLITAGEHAPFDAPDYVEVIYGESEQMVERADVSSAIGRITGEWLVDNVAPAVRTVTEKRMIGKPMAGTSKAMVRQGYRTIMPVSLFLRLANAKDVAMRFGTTEVVLDEAGRSALALAGSQLRAVRIRPRVIAVVSPDTSVNGSSTTQATKPADAGTSPRVVQAGEPTLVPAGSKPDQSSKAARTMLAQVQGVWADVASLGNKSYFRFEEGGSAVHFAQGQSLPPQPVRYAVEPSKHLILLYYSEKATVPFLTLSLASVTADLLTVTPIAQITGSFYRLDEPMQYRRVTISDGVEIERRQTDRFVQMQGLRF
jgi:hypothetical protein